MSGDHHRAWMRCARIAGCVALINYFAVPVLHLPPWAMGRWMFVLIGPAIALAAFALLQGSRTPREDPPRTIGLWATVIAGLTMHLMAIVQDSNFTTMRNRLAAADDAATRKVEEAVLWGVNNVQLALDVSFDLWIAGGGIFLAVGLLLAGRRRWMGILGLAAAAFALAMNVWKYPSPPAEVGGVDGGPYLATWLGIYLWLESGTRPDDGRVGAPT